MSAPEDVTKAPAPLQVTVTGSLNLTPPTGDSQIKNSWSDRILEALDWVLAFSERTAAMAALVLVFWWTISMATLWDSSQEVAPNWMIISILIVGLLYRTARMFLENVRSAWGMHRMSQTADQTPNDMPKGMNS